MGPHNISHTVEARNFKFGTETDGGEYWVKRGYVGSRDPILEFWDFLISRERLKLESSNLARRRTAVNSNEKEIQNWVKWGHVGVTSPNFGILGPPKYFANG